jgi:hypothetical protein
MIAGATQSQNASLGNKVPKIVDAHPGRLSGIANFADKKRPSAKPMSGMSVKTPGAKAPPVSTHLKASGHPQAHMLGGGSKPLKSVKLKI